MIAAVAAIQTKRPIKDLAAIPEKVLLKTQERVDARIQAQARDVDWECVDTDWTDNWGDGCEWYDEYPSGCGYYDDGTGGSAWDECCSCGGGDYECIDGNGVDSYGDGCEWYDDYPSGCGYYDTEDFQAEWE